MMKRLVVTGSMLRPQPSRTRRAQGGVDAAVWPLIEAGRLRPIVDRVFAFENAPAAHAYMESGAHIGKILLRVDAGANRAGA